MGINNLIILLLVTKEHMSINQHLDTIIKQENALLKLYKDFKNLMKVLPSSIASKFRPQETALEDNLQRLEHECDQIDL